MYDCIVIGSTLKRRSRSPRKYIVFIQPANASALPINLSTASVLVNRSTCKQVPRNSPLKRYCHHLAKGFLVALACADGFLLQARLQSLNAQSSFALYFLTAMSITANCQRAVPSVYYHTPEKLPVEEDRGCTSNF